MMNRVLGALCLLIVAAPPVRATEKPKVEFRDGDRIALIGNEFFEREEDRGYIETQLTTRFPDRKLTFRNLGYSGDTVDAEARNLCAGWENFGPPEQGLNRLRQLVGHIKPTLIFVAYGMNESFAGGKGLEHYLHGLNRMLDMLAEGGPRIVLLSPIRHEDLGRPLPDPAEHNKNIRLYIEATEKIAQQRGFAFINLYEALGDGTKATPAGALTSDGIHLTPYGYWRTAIALEQALGYPPREWRVELQQLRQQNNSNGDAKLVGTELKDSKAMIGSGNQSELRFTLRDQVLPLAPPPENAPSAVRNGQILLPGQQRVLKITGLPAGARFVLESERQIVAKAASDEWAKGIQLRDPRGQEQEEHLRQAVIAKNFDFFNYWRPQNDTYIFGYRQHEQGRNAAEIPRFEPLVEAKEKEIARLRLPAAQTFTVRRETK